MSQRGQGRRARVRDHPSRRALVGDHLAVNGHQSGRVSRHDCREDHPMRRRVTNRRDARVRSKSHRARRHPNRSRHRGVDSASRRVGGDQFRRHHRCRHHRCRHHATPSGRLAACFVETAPAPSDYHRPNGLCPFPSVSHAGCRARQLLAAALAGEHIQRPGMILTPSDTLPSVSYPTRHSTSGRVSGLESAHLAPKRREKHWRWRRDECARIQQ